MSSEALQHATGTATAAVTTAAALTTGTAGEATAAGTGAHGGGGGGAPDGGGGGGGGGAAAASAAAAATTAAAAASSSSALQTSSSSSALTGNAGIDAGDSGASGSHPAGAATAGGPGDSFAADDVKEHDFGNRGAGANGFDTLLPAGGGPAPGRFAVDPNGPPLVSDVAAAVGGADATPGEAKPPLSPSSVPAPSHPILPLTAPSTSSSLSTSLFAARLGPDGLSTAAAAALGPGAGPGSGGRSPLSLEHSLRPTPWDFRPAVCGLLSSLADAGDVQSCVAIVAVLSSFPFDLHCAENAGAALRGDGETGLAGPLRGVPVRLARAWFFSYIDILHRLQLFDIATEAINAARGFEIEPAHHPAPRDASAAQHGQKRAGAAHDASSYDTAAGTPSTTKAGGAFSSTTTDDSESAERGSTAAGMSLEASDSSASVSAMQRRRRTHRSGISDATGKSKGQNGDNHPSNSNSNSNNSNSNNSNSNSNGNSSSNGTSNGTSSSGNNNNSGSLSNSGGSGGGANGRKGHGAHGPSGGSASAGADDPGDLVSELNLKSTLIHTSCGRCGRALLEPGSSCGKCRSFVRGCSVCHVLVKGLYVWCQGCQHGGHLEHMTEWFAENEECPTGCGHKCRPHLVNSTMAGQ